MGNQVRRNLMLGCYVLCYGRLEMDLEGLAERLRHEMELINETELVLGSTALSHSYFLQVENLKGLTAMGSQKPRARKRFRYHVWAVLFVKGSTSQGTAC
ncbi:hypothetical protein BDE02_02G007800 [Populus trichocarpa]|nr:hypothetical protein BDE02_02G007800 [Populus trichocarpa]